MTWRTWRRHGATVIAILLCLFRAGAAHAADPVYDVSGAQRGRDYVSTLPFEHVDTVTGNVIFTFTDLVLPGDAGFNLAIGRTYNSRDGQWRFGINGAPIKLLFLPPSNDLTNIDFVSPDGATYNTTGVADTTFTKNYWRFTKSTLTLEMPNGVVAIYGQLVTGVGRYLTEIHDPFGNAITLTWQGGAAVLQSVTQHVGDGHTRTVTFSGWASERPNSFTYDGRTWTYEWETLTATPENVIALKTFSAPVGGTWTFTYGTDPQGGVRVTTVKTANGGQVTYVWGTETFPTTPADRVVLQSRTTGSGVPAGTWSFDWQNTGAKLVVSGPANTVTYDFSSQQGEPLATTVTVAAAGGGAVLSQEVRVFTFIPGTVGSVPVLQSRVVTRGGNNFVTGFGYASNDYYNYGRPTEISELGQITRTAAITYQHAFGPYIRGRVQSTAVTVNGQTMTASSTYDTATGFQTSATAFGRTTTFTRDGRGNIATATDANGHTSTFTSDWGVMQTADSPAHTTITRTLNSDGTVATETAGGVTTTFTYDAIGRVTSASSPGRAPVTTAYDVVSGAWVRTVVARGSSSVTTDLDGFGRPVHTLDAAGVQSRVQYDAAGRQIYRSYPYGGGVSEVGSTTAFDGLGRATLVTKPDGSTIGMSYLGGGTSVQVAEQVSATETHTTTRTFQAFGDPDDARLTQFTDASGVAWGYQYDGAGNVTLLDTVATTTARRMWSYDARNFVASEVHPESGVTTYQHDNMGNVTLKTDARGTAVAYAYDADDRLVSVNAPGTDDDITSTYNALGQLVSLSSAAVQTTFAYDGSGRPIARTDVMSGRTFTQTFAYDSEDRLTTHTYPSGRKVLYTYGAQGRVTAVKTQIGTGAEKTLASGLSYTGAGALAGFQFGNGLAQGLTFDTRQRPTGWTSGPLSLTYTYDFIGNVKAINDARQGFSATYTYDVLDRLTGVFGYGATSYTYDAAGNRLTAGNVTYAYQCCGTNRLASVSGGITGTFTYSANGNVLTDPDGLTYSYTAANLMKSSTLGGNTTTYKYGGDGFRHIKVKPNGVEQYAIRAGSNLIAEYESVGTGTTITREYVYLGATLLAALEPQTAAPPALSVAITTPTSGQGLTYGQTITLTATVSVPQGTTIARVEYYNDGFYVGQATSGTYPVSFQNVSMAVGSHTLLARVVTTDNHAVTSAPVSWTAQ